MKYENFVRGYDGTQPDCIPLAYGLLLPPSEEFTRMGPAKEFAARVALSEQLVALFHSNLDTHQLLTPDAAAYADACEQRLSGRQYFFVVHPNEAFVPNDHLAIEGDG